MEVQNKKCSFKDHKNIDAIKYCQECNIYICNKCEKTHSGFFENHHTLALDKEIDEFFTGYCKEKNHPIELSYFCKDHNTLCCPCCIAKIKTQGNGTHFDCNVCDINDISEEKKKNLSNNIKSLEKLYDLFQALLNDLKKAIQEIDDRKEEVKKDILQIFTGIRDELNKREDQLLKEVDQIYENKFNSKNIDNIIKDKKFSEKIKIYIDKGKIAEKDWNKINNKAILINDCINIENTIDKINNMNISIEKYKIQDKKLNFNCNTDDIINLIKTFGSFNKTINQQEVNININNFNPQNLNYIKQISSNYGCGNSFCYDGVCFFISKNNEYVLSYIDSSYKSIIFYDINNNNEIKKFNNAHDSDIYTIKHYPYDKYDIILSTSYNNDIKLWNYNEGINILTISKIYDNNNYVYSGCIIFDKNNFNIFCTGCQNYIKIYNQTGEFIKNIGNNDVYYRCYIDSSEIEDKKYILVGGNKGIQTFNYPELNEYYTFIEGNDTQYHNEAKIIKINNNYNLIDTGTFNYIKIWDFINKNLITKINSNNTSDLRGYMIINNRYLFIGSNDNQIKEFDLEKKIIIKNINKHTSTVYGIKPVKDKNGNEFIVSYGTDKNIYLWGFN